ncbi:sulfatase-like hydrolase/transferase [Kiritimatiellota bacterium B12222]|nr:sulfatase-like hydrolase/transferase [Kiritimatiellota bacterium B12222]
MKQPHIIIFNPDQWRGDVLRHQGNPAAVTPHLDQFAAEEGVSFSQAFCQNPVCTPSRCSYMTGWYPHVRGHRTMNHMLHADRGEPNLLKVLKDEGYFVWWGGKNDLLARGPDLEAACDVRFEATAADYERWGLTPREGAHAGNYAWRGEPDDDMYFSFLKGKLDKGDEEVYADSDWARFLGALDFIGSYDGEKPLCIYLPLDYPHPPYGVEEPWYSMIDRGMLLPRVPAPESWEGAPSILEKIYRNQKLQGLDEETWSELRGTYYGSCARLDHQFGMLMDALKQQNFYDDAAIFMFSDHGDFTGDYGLVEKASNTMQDCLTRVPFLFKPPAGVPVKPGNREALVELVDFSATVYDLLQLDPGYDSFGKSLLPLAAGKTTVHRDAVFCEGGRRPKEYQAVDSGNHTGEPADPLGLYGPRIVEEASEDPFVHCKAVMCRTSSHKYVRRYGELDELYDLTRDPREQQNRIGDPAYREILSELRERLTDWYMETCDVIPQQKDLR